MKLPKTDADVFVPDGLAMPGAIERTTHLAIAAHQDDIEIMAYHGIGECFARRDKWFSGVVATNGAGSPRTGIYGDCTDAEMQRIRLVEQRKAAYVGEYACQIQLGFTSAQAKDPRETQVGENLAAILRAARPEVVYLHNLADKHDTHVGVALKAIGALRAVQEGTLVFAEEPLLQVTGPVLEAQIVETYLLSVVHFETLVASKAARVVRAAGGRSVLEFGTRRAHGPRTGQEPWTVFLQAVRRCRAAVQLHSELRKGDGRRV